MGFCGRKRYWRAMTLNQIRNVVAIAERGSLRSAARALGVTNRLSPAAFASSSTSWA